ncbi:MAG: hypothetical protein IKP73_04725 [Bacteroidales bacterium]|nr:hypothetical protein [Bacteroidales bacterium]
MKANYYLNMLLAALLLLASCNKSDDNNSDPNEGGEGNKTIFIQSIPYSLTVSGDSTLSKVAYTESEDGSKINISFTKEDVAKPLVMTITGDNVSGTLTLQNVNGEFSGTIDVPLTAPDTLLLTGTIEIPAAGEEDDDCSNISLADVMKKCGHTYTVKFEYRGEKPVYLTDSKAYFEFRMSQYQRWMRINNRKYTMNKEGRLWLAVDEKTSVVTNFYRRAYEQVKGGNLYVINRVGFVDLGIRNILWADKNVGAENMWEFGSYYDWEDAVKSVTLPLELPSGGEDGDDSNDFWVLCQNTTHVFAEYNGVPGVYFLLPGCEVSENDLDNNPFIFFPGAGALTGGSRTSVNNCLYWSSKEYDKANAYRLFARDGWIETDSRIHKSSVGAFSARPIRRSNNQDEEGKYNEELKTLVAFFPTGYENKYVSAWYTYKDIMQSEEWALYLFDDNTYIATLHRVQKGQRVLYNAGTFKVDGDIDPDYNDFETTFLLGVSEIPVEFSGGKCTFLEKRFVRETGAVPDATELTKDNTKANMIYFPPVLTLDRVAAWYKQAEVVNNVFLVLYILYDKTFYVSTCQVKDGEQRGSLLANGTLKVKDGNEMDYMNVDMEATAFNVGMEMDPIHLDVAIRNGKATIYGVTMELQDLASLYELIGD